MPLVAEAPLRSASQLGCGSDLAEQVGTSTGHPHCGVSVWKDSEGELTLPPESCVAQGVVAPEPAFSPLLSGL